MRHPARAPSLLALLLVVAACSSPSTSPGVSPSGSIPGGIVTPAPSPSPAPTGVPTPTARVAATIHTVSAGETLSSIARSYGTTMQQLQAWNADRYPSLNSNPNAIEPGWELIVSEEANVTPLPTPSPTPPPSGAGCTAGNRVAAGSAQTFRTIPGAGPSVALTFDMGGRMDPAVDILKFLVANRVCATIFATGAMSQTAHGQAALAIVRAHPELFEMGNHTMYHCDLVRGGGGSPTTAPCVGGPFTASRIQKELTDAEAILRAATGQNPQPYWRPPYGSTNAAVIDAAAAAGYTKTFLWDIDTIDWKPISDGGPTAEQIAAKVIGDAVNGSNVLFHLGGYETLDSLRLIVPALRDRGFALTSLSDLLN
jgi:peptidoglycan/xylan/chitin deacetylase (PgdA/CDA1 family)